MSVSGPSAVRLSCADVVTAAAHVHINAAALHTFAESLVADVAAVTWDAEDWHFADRERPQELATYILVLDAINFCFWPSKTELEYDAIAVALKKVMLETPDALSPAGLVDVTADSLTKWLAPHDVPLVDERVAKLQELGAVLQDKFDGSALRLLASCGGSAARLVDTITANFPGFRDQAVYRGRQVFFYKRAQIVVADLWAAFGKQLQDGPPSGTDAPPPGAFYDMHELTMFADYRVPQLLRHAGVMVYSDALAAAVDKLEPVAVGSEEEIEIRAATVVAVDMLRDLLRGSATAAVGPDAGSGAGAGVAAAAVGSVSGLAVAGNPFSVELDWVLWQAGEAQRKELLPHHRTLTCFY